MSGSEGGPPFSRSPIYIGTGYLVVDHYQPLVSIGVPTYNRATSLTRAVESILAQDYANLEVVISDNASTDGTQDVCLDIQRLDPRVRYGRTPENIGPIRNFREVLARASGEYFMWLADDDWLSDHYISRCVEFLNGSREYSAVHGVEQEYMDGKLVGLGDSGDIDDADPVERVLAYYHRVWTNGVFYSLTRRSQLAGISFRSVAGWDWTLVAELAFLGKVKQLETVSLNRSRRDEASLRTIRGDLSLSLPGAVLWYVKSATSFLLISFHAGAEICWRSPIYGALRPLSRYLLGGRICAVVLMRNIATICKKIPRVIGP